MSTLAKQLMTALSPFHASIILDIVKAHPYQGMNDRHGLDNALEEYIAVAEVHNGKLVHASPDLYRFFGGKEH